MTVGVLGYLVAFLRVDLPSLPPHGPSGAVWNRIDFALLLFTPLQLASGLAERWLGNPPDVGLLDRLPVLLIVIMIWAVAGAAGWLVLRRMHAEIGLSRLEALVFACGVGLSLVSLFTLLAGLAGLLFSPLVFAVVGAIVLAMAGRHFRVFVFRRFGPRDEKHAIRSAAASASDSARLFGRRWLWLAFPFAAVILFGGMLPPLEFDVREYHLEVPKEFYQQGKITFLPHNVYGNMPLGAEMLSLAAMVVMDDWWLGALAGKAAIALFAPLTAVALYAAGRRWFTTPTGVVAALVYLSIPWVVRVSTSGLVEGVMGFYLLAAGYAFWLWRDAVRLTPGMSDQAARGRLLLCGLLAGGAGAVKYTALPLVVLPLAGAVLIVARRRAGELVFFTLAAAMVCGPWFAKNWALTGNPTYPLMAEMFDGQTRTEAKNAQWNVAHHPPNYAITDFVGRLGRLALRSEWISPLLAPLVALSLLVVRDRRRVGECLLYASVYWIVWWLFTHRLDRFWVPLLPLLALLAGVGAAWRRDRAWRWLLAALLLFGLAGNLLVSVLGPGGYNRYFVRLAKLRDDPERMPPWYEYLDHHVPPGQRVLSVGDAAVFDLRVLVLYNTVFDTCRFEQIVRDRSPDEIRRRLADVSHIYVNWGEIARYRSPGNYGFTDFVQPRVFDRLIAGGILDPPLDKFTDSPVDIFPVRHAAHRAPR